MLIISIILQSFLILVFLITGTMKIAGNQQLIETFKHLNLPQWFRVVTGWVQVIGVAGLVIGFWNPAITALAGGWLAITMLGGVITHLRAKDPIGKVVPALVLAVLSIIVLFINYSELFDILL